MIFDTSRSDDNTVGDDLFCLELLDHVGAQGLDVVSVALKRHA